MRSDSEERDGAVGLAGGRTLAYAELGDPTGPPVVVLDGPGSRGLARAAAPATAQLGVRLVAPDRPGFGGSTPQPDRTVASWPNDLRQLAEALRISSFGILAQSGGTPFALATAALLPLQVTAVSLLGAVSPLGEADALEGVGQPMRTLFHLARKAPWALRPLLAMSARQARRAPERAAEQLLRDLPTADEEAMRDPANRAIHLRTYPEIMRDHGEMAREMALLARPWGFDVADVRAPVAMWVGDRDVTHPPIMSRRLEARLRDARVHVLRDCATFGLSAIYPDALRFASSGRGAPRV